MPRDGQDGPTLGVEMETLCAVQVCQLTPDGRCDAMDRSMTVDLVCRVDKSGVPSGQWRRGHQNGLAAEQWPGGAGVTP